MIDFDEIFRTYFSDVFRYIRRLSNDEHIAEEITADTFFKAIPNSKVFCGININIVVSGRKNTNKL